MAAVDAAVVRVKRRFDEEPLDALVLACKRRKNDSSPSNEQNNPFTTILKFAGTVKNQDENVALHISTYKKDVKTITHVADLGGKLRAENRKSVQESRFKVVNGFRSLDTPPEKSEPLLGTNAVNEGNLKNVVILDLEDSKPVKEGPEGSIPESYVYDLYYTGDGGENLDDALLDQMLSVQPLQNDYMWQDPVSDSECAEDDKDSNDENNSCNEYPDTEDSMDDDMKLALELGAFHIGNEELSSDEADEEYLRYEDADPEDIARYGQGYAKYKARITKELYNHSDTSDSEDDDDADEKVEGRM